MDSDFKDNLKNQSTWKRALYILVFLVCYALAEVVVYAVVIFQLLLKLFTGHTNDRLHKLGQSLSTYVYQILQYITFNSDYQPYPFGAWPRREPKATAQPAHASEGEAG